MKTTEEIKEKVKELETQIKGLVEGFVKIHGECIINISCYARFIKGVSEESFYAGHDIEVTITI